jgi:hypothetical protein
MPVGEREGGLYPVNAIMPYLQNDAFGPAEITAMSMALDDVCKTLNLRREIPHGTSSPSASSPWRRAAKEALHACATAYCLRPVSREPRRDQNA